jgi:aspartate/methionine/tyrosine aminotransferase
MAVVHGFGIDRVAHAADRVTARWPVLRLENLDTDLPLPPEAVPVTAAALTTPKANSWLPFTGDDDLRAAIADLLAGRTGHRYDPAEEIVVTSGGTEAALDCLLATVDPGDEVVLTDPTYAGLVNRVRLVGGLPRFVPYRVGRRRVAAGPGRACHRHRPAYPGPAADEPVHAFRRGARR